MVGVEAPKIFDTRELNIFMVGEATIFLEKRKAKVLGATTLAPLNTPADARIVAAMARKLV